MRGWDVGASFGVLVLVVEEEVVLLGLDAAEGGLLEEVEVGEDLRGLGFHVPNLARMSGSSCSCSCSSSLSWSFRGRSRGCRSSCWLAGDRERERDRRRGRGERLSSREPLCLTRS